MSHAGILLNVKRLLQDLDKYVKEGVCLASSQYERRPTANRWRAALEVAAVLAFRRVLGK
jgi:hypothetical protein